MQGSPLPLLVFSLLVSLILTECMAVKVGSLGKVWPKIKGAVKKEAPSKEVPRLLLSLVSVCSFFSTFSVGGGTVARVHILVSCTNTFITEY